jgi:hypothetical protein
MDDDERFEIVKKFVMKLFEKNPDFQSKKDDEKLQCACYAMLHIRRTSGGTKWKYDEDTK